jgi:hypothetical protein
MRSAGHDEKLPAIPTGRAGRAHALDFDLSRFARMAYRLRSLSGRLRFGPTMQPSPTERSSGRARDENAASRLPLTDETRAWPRCEPAFTHFELGASSEYRPTTVTAKRYTPRYGARKD